MDKYNVITPTLNLDELENDMTSWANLPYEFRLRSDDNCIRQYGMTNIQLFNKLKSSILSKADFDDPIAILSSNITEATTDKFQSISNYNFEDDEELLWKLQMSENLQTSPEVVIIDPYIQNNNEYGLDELNNKFAKFGYLNSKNKRFSNYYSLNIWGYDVPNMYRIMKLKLDPNSQLLENKDIVESDNYMQPVLNNINTMIVENDILGLLRTKINLCSNIPLYEKTIIESCIEDIDNTINYSSEDILDCIPAVSPFFTPDEMEGMVPTNFDNIDPNLYYKDLIDTMEKYNNSTGEEKISLENKLIFMGWNPSVKVTKESIKYAREKQIRYLNKKSVKIIDLTKINCLAESCKFNRDLYKNSNLYPVFIVLSYNNSLFGKIINFVKKSEYSHVGIALESRLNSIFTFKYDKIENGVAVESLVDYIDKYNDSKLMVLSLFVDKATRIKLEDILSDYVLHKSGETRYNFENLFNILFNKAKKYKNNLKMVCSQFVDTILKLVNIDITNKPSNLVHPQYFQIVSEDNPKIYKLYEGLAREYDEQEVDNKIASIFKNYSLKSIRYNELLESMSNNFTIESFFNIIEDNNQANDILIKAMNLLTPTAVIYERRLPFSFNDKGDISIDFIKSLEQQYQDSHKLLISYNKENTEGIKHELAHLFLINNIIEKKIKKMKKDSDSYKPLIDLRARVLNDFKKYFKLILNQEPDFNFAEYFKKSDYYDNNIVIDNNTLKFSGKLIVQFLKTLGI